MGYLNSSKRLVSGLYPGRTNEAVTSMSTQKLKDVPLLWECRDLTTMLTLDLTAHGEICATSSCTAWDSSMNTPELTGTGMCRSNGATSHQIGSTTFTSVTRGVRVAVT